jgi:hypothetical protein
MGKAESKTPADLTLSYLFRGESTLAWFFKDFVGTMANTSPAVSTLRGVDRGVDYYVRLMNNHADLLLGLTLVAGPVMGLMQSAGFVGARTLELEQFTLTDPEYGEQALYARTVRLKGLSLFSGHVRHSLYFL